MVDVAADDAIGVVAPRFVDDDALDTDDMDDETDDIEVDVEVEDDKGEGDR